MKNFKFKKSIICIILCICFICCLSGCDQAYNVQNNIVNQSNNFNTYRRVTVINLRSDKILMEVEGYIAIKDSAQDELAIIIQVGKNEYQMHYVYLGGEVAYLVEQTNNTATDPYHWEIHIFALKPEIVLE